MNLLAAAADSSARLCTICLNTVVEDNSRGKAELVCGHLFHLDCIGSEFNYRNEMKCPNCRVVESGGEWLLPDEDIDEDEEITMQVVNNRRFDLHIYSHGGRARDQNDDEENRSPAIPPTVHYHHHHHHHMSNTALPSGSVAIVHDTNPVGNSMLRTFSNPQPQGSDPRPRVRVEHVVLPDRSSSRPNVGNIRTNYYGAPAPAPHHLHSAALDSMARSMQQRREHEAMPSYNFNDNPSLDLTLNLYPNEDRSNEEQPAGTPEVQSPHEERNWFEPLDQ